MTYARLVEIIGPDAALVLVSEAGGQEIPTARQAVRERIEAALARGLTPAQVAERYGIGRKYAERIRRRLYMARRRVAPRSISTN